MYPKIELFDQLAAPAPGHVVTSSLRRAPDEFEFELDEREEIFEGRIYHGRRSREHDIEGGFF